MTTNVQLKIYTTKKKKKGLLPRAMCFLSELRIS